MPCLGGRLFLFDLSQVIPGCMTMGPAHFGCAAFTVELLTATPAPFMRWRNYYGQVGRAELLEPGKSSLEFRFLLSSLFIMDMVFDFSETSYPPLWEARNGIKPRPSQ